jgi:hypothetical protein
VKQLFFVLSFSLLLLAACGAETIVGPEDAGGVLEPAEECGVDAKPC